MKEINAFISDDKKLIDQNPLKVELYEIDAILRREWGNTLVEDWDDALRFIQNNRQGIKRYLEVTECLS